jgi:hypothetical protein
MDELAPKYVENHNKKIVEERYELAKRLEELEKMEKGGSLTCYFSTVPIVKG